MGARLRAILAALMLSVAVTLCLTSSASASQCPASNPNYNGPCGPEFTLPSWGDAGGWTDPSHYSTIHLADVLGNGRDQLIARSAAGIEIYEFDTTLGQWRPEVDAAGQPVILRAFADPPPLTSASPNPVATDWTRPQYYSSIQTGDLLGTGHDQIIARSSHGVFVYSYTPGANGGPGTWKETDSGAFNTEPTTVPGWYPTIGIGNLTGSGTQVWGLDAGISLRAVQWSSLKVLNPGPTASFNPGSAADTLQVSPAINGRQKLYYLSPQGMRGLSLQPARGGGETFLDDSDYGTLPFAYSGGPPPYTPWDRWEYSQTIHFENVSGGSDVDLVGRGIDGLEVYRLTPDRHWQQLATLTALSNANGFGQEQYWRSITYGDLNGDGREDVVARGPNGVVAYTYNPASNSWSQLPGSINLTDDPWGSSASFYSTFRLGNATGDGRDDTLVARGPYGIRTWFYDRPGQPGWGPYLPAGYPSFTGAQQAAYEMLNQNAAKANVFMGNEQAIRDIWTQNSAPTADQLTNLLSELATLGNCTGETSFAPPKYQTCVPPTGSSGFTQADWTDVVNELLSEAFDAKNVVQFYATLDDIRSSLFISEGAELPAIGDKLHLAGFADTTGDFDMSALAAGLLGVVASATGEEESAGFWIASEIASMIPSASPAFSDTFAGTYNQLQGEFATATTQADAASATQNFEVRSDLNLMRLVTDLTRRGTWQFDKVGSESAGNEAFTLWVYKTLLPVVYSHYDITNCVDALYNNNPLVYSCAGPPDGPWVSGDDNNRDFQDVETRPQSGFPCHEHLQGYTFDCAWNGPDPAIEHTVSDPVSSQCTYAPPSTSHVWSFGCSLGVPTSEILPTDPLTDQSTWDFPLVTGAPIPGLSASGSADVSAGRTNATVRLAGRVPGAGGRSLKGASVAIDRVLAPPRRGPNLVRRPLTGLGAQPGGSRSAPLGSVVLHQSSSGGFGTPKSATQTQAAASIQLRLARHKDRSLTFKLKVSHVVMPSLPNLCGRTRAATAFRPRPFPLNLRMRILRSRQRPLAISVTPTFACRYDRSGAARGLTIVRNARHLKLGQRLSVKFQQRNRLRAHRLGTLAATVSNPTRTTAHDVLVRAVVPPGLRITGRSPRARISGHQVIWRVATLRGRRSRTVRILVVPARAQHARQCTYVSVSARIRKTATATSCVAVGAAGSPPRGRG